MPPARTSSKPAAKRRRKSAAKSRAKRSNPPWRPRLPVLEQHHLDLAGLGLIALGVFLAFPLYLGWDGGRVGDGIVDGLALLIGALRSPAPVAVAAVGMLVVLRPMLPSVRPFRSGGVLLLAALA